MKNRTINAINKYAFIDQSCQINQVINTVEESIYFDTFLKSPLSVFFRFFLLENALRMNLIMQNSGMRIIVIKYFVKKMLYTKLSRS
jgi:hypothetical protein